MCPVFGVHYNSHHYGGAHQGGFSANQEGVQPNNGRVEPGGQEAAALAQQLNEKGGEQASQNRTIESIKSNAKSMWFSS
jgi:hypothetical protein